MFINNIKIAFRNLFRDKVSSFINIFGLSIGLASVLFILLFVQNEWQVDQGYEHSDRVYRLTYDETKKIDNGRHLVTTSPPMGSALVADYEEIETAVRLRYMDQVLLENQHQHFYESNLVYADKDFFQLFSFPLQAGDPTKVLSEPNSIVLSPGLAQKYFGTKNPMGKDLVLDGNTPLKVTGILKEKPTKTHLRFDALVSFSTFKVPYGYPVTLESWGWISFHTYLLLKKEAKQEDLAAKLPAFLGRHFSPERAGRADLRLQALSDIYFESGGMMNTDKNKLGNTIYTYGLLCVAFLILLVAGFNFMNISTARSIKRAREVGVRKVLGAQKSGLIGQFLQEGLLTAMASFVVAIFIFQVSQSHLLSYLGWDFSLSFSDLWQMIALLLVITLVLGSLASLYPAFVLSRFKPIKVLKGVFTTNPSELNLRKTLVVFQFTITAALIAGSLIVHQQMDFIQNKTLGYDSEQVISLQMRTDNFLENYGAAEQILKQNPYVLSVSAGDVIDGDYGSVPMFKEGDENGTAMHILGGYFNYFNTLGVEMVAGRDFSDQHPQDSVQGIIINETAARFFAWEDPIGKKIRIDDIKEGEVIGVVKDFHFKSLHDPIQPQVAFVPETHMEYLIVRIRPGNTAETIASLQKDWEKIAADLPFQFAFLDDQIQAQYVADERFSQLISFFSFLTIFIAALGLYGLIAIMTALKVKEIGIRKVLGASVFDISFLLSKSFLQLVILANLIALPIAWLVMQKWLEGFSYHVQIKPFLFGLTLVLSLLITFVALSYQVLRSAFRHPIEALRQE